MMRTSRSGSICLARSRTPIPPRPGILRSSVMTSTGSRAIASSAAWPLLAVTTSHSPCRIARSDSRTPISSSTTNTRDRRLIVECSGAENMPRGVAPRAPIHGHGGPAAPSRPFRLERPHVGRGTCARTRASPLRGRDAQLVHAVLEDAPCRSEQLGGARLVEVRLPEGFDDDVALELVDRIAERLPALEDLLPDGPGILLAAPHLVGQLLDPDRRPLGEHEQALHQVLELTHVPRPVVAHEDVDRLGLEGLLRDAHVVRLLLREVADQEQEVVAPLAQRGQVHGHHVEAVVEVGAERALLQAERQVAVGGRDDAHVDVDRLGAAHAQELAVLEDAQQLGLRPWTHLADLVQEERASWASSNCPSLRVWASVNEPFSCPKSSLSRSVSGMAAQLSVTSER